MNNITQTKRGMGWSMWYGILFLITVFPLLFMGASLAQVIIAASALTFFFGLTWVVVKTLQWIWRKIT